MKIIITIIHSIFSTFKQLLRHSSDPTPDNQSTLYVCRTPEDLNKIEVTSHKENVVVGSNNPKVHAVARENTQFDRTYLQRPISFYEIADDALDISKTIEEWLMVIGENAGIPADLLFTQKSIEGGELSRVQHALLLIMSYREVFEDHGIESIHLQRTQQKKWQDNILVAVADSQDIPVFEEKSLSYVFKSPFTFEPLSFDIREQTISISVPKQVKDILRAGHLLMRLLRGKTRISTTDTDRPEITFQLSSSAQKHIDNIDGVMRELEESDRFQPVALCWNAKGGAKALENSGHEVINLTDAFPILRMGELILKGIKIKIAGYQYSTSLVDNKDFCYKGVRLGPHLWADLRSLVFPGIPRRLAIMWASEEYFRTRRPVALKPWGAGRLEYGKISLDVAKRICNPVIFHYNLGVGADNPYFQNTADFYIAKGQREKTLYADHGVDPGNVIMAGQSRYDGIDRFNHSYSQNDSRIHLNINTEQRLCIFYASSNDVPGVTSKVEKIQTLNTLMSVANDFPSCTLLIKPHPSENPEPIKTLVNDSDNGNVHFVKESSPYHCINAADVVVTKHSTVGIEAMLFDRPIVSVALDGESRFQDVYGDVAERLSSTEQLYDIFSDILMNHEQLPDQSSTRAEFLGRMFGKNSQNRAAELTATAIERRVNPSDEIPEK